LTILLKSIVTTLSVSTAKPLCMYTVLHTIFTTISQQWFQITTMVAFALATSKPVKICM